MNEPIEKSCPSRGTAEKLGCPGGRATEITDAPPAPMNVAASASAAKSTTETAKVPMNPGMSSGLEPSQGGSLEDITEFRFRS